VHRHKLPDKSGWTDMASKEQETIMGVSGRWSTDRAPGQGGGGFTEGESIFAFQKCKWGTNLSILLSGELLKYTYNRILLHFCLESFSKSGELRRVKAQLFQKWGARAKQP